VTTLWQRREVIGDCTLYLGDCLEIMPTLGKVDAVVTSPPYNLGNAVKGSFYDGKSKGATISYNTYSDDMGPLEYEAWQHRLFDAWFDIITDGGVIAYNHKPRIEGGIYDDRKNLIPYPVRQEIIWDRCCMVNFSGGFFAPQTERIYLVCKDGWRPNREFVGWGDIWRIPPETTNPHPAPFPLKLADRLLRGCTKPGAVVLDPFMGSGTTLVACAKLGRKGIGIELDEGYFDIACKRVADAYRQPDFFVERPAPSEQTEFNMQSEEG